MTNSKAPGPDVGEVLEREGEPCPHKRTEMRNYDMAMHDGDIHCADCGKFLRFWDAG